MAGWPGVDGVSSLWQVAGKRHAHPTAMNCALAFVESLLVSSDVVEWAHVAELADALDSGSSG